MIDTHCHLTNARFADDVDDVLMRAHAAGVETCVTIGTGIEDATRARDLAARHAGTVYATAGLDPFSSHAAGASFDPALAALDELLAGGGFVAVGEIGLDYHYDLDPRPVQAERLERQLELADRRGLPVVIHVRDAHADMAAVLARHPRVGGVIHSFTGGPDAARRYLDLGWSLAFNGVLTFKNAAEIREAARRAPLDRVLIETDSPFLAPVPVRGGRCEPAYVAHILSALAEIRSEDAAALEAATTANARTVFGIVR
jgi:TatD DNase family protein